MTLSGGRTCGVTFFLPQQYLVFFYKDFPHYALFIVFFYFLSWPKKMTPFLLYESFTFCQGWGSGQSVCVCIDIIRAFSTALKRNRKEETTLPETIDIVIFFKLLFFYFKIQSAKGLSLKVLFPFCR